MNLELPDPQGVDVLPDTGMIRAAQVRFVTFLHRAASYENTVKRLTPPGSTDDTQPGLEPSSSTPYRTGPLPIRTTV